MIEIRVANNRRNPSTRKLVVTPRAKPMRTLDSEAVRWNPVLLLRSLWRNRAPLLALSLPRLVTAAIVPTFILIFTAEIWDAGLNMSNRVAWSFAVPSILGATWYLAGVQNPFFPRKEKRIDRRGLLLILSVKDGTNLNRQWVRHSLSAGAPGRALRSGCRRVSGCDTL